MSTDERLEWQRRCGLPTSGHQAIDVGRDITKSVLIRSTRWPLGVASQGPSHEGAPPREVEPDCSFSSRRHQSGRWH